jgi:hypothetical protein
MSGSLLAILLEVKVKVGGWRENASKCIIVGVTLRILHQSLEQPKEISGLDYPEIIQNADPVVYFFK